MITNKLLQINIYNTVQNSMLCNTNNLASFVFVTTALIYKYVVTFSRPMSSLNILLIEKDIHTRFTH